MAGKKILSEAEVDEQAESEFLDEARDILNGLEITLQDARTGGVSAADAAKTVRREVSNLNIRAKASRLPVLSIVTHKLDDYMASLQALDGQKIDDVQSYVDKLNRILDGDVHDVTKVPEVVRELPSRSTFEVSDITAENIEVLLVMPQRSAARVVERELMQCGYRVTNVLDPFESIEMAVRMKPDMIISAAVLGEISGIDLLNALAAMPITRNIPTAVLTSLAPNHADLANLPLRTGLIRRGEHFGDDLAHVLQRFDIT